ncbi:hypothetical protein K4K60_001057 [Colletotrichum sp. SAR11_57]|nr:hypothetical protein K4K60_001057 [Colletotrichum sp. SAR11_57]
MPNSLRRVKTEVSSPTQDYNYSEDAAILRKKTDDGPFHGLPAKRQTRWKVIAKVLSRWGITMAVIVSIYVVIWVYSSKPVMSQTTKRQYNALITGLSIALEKVVKSNRQGLGALQYTANSYGTVSLAYDSAAMEKVPSARAIYVESDPLMFCDENLCKYVFHETSTSSIKDDDTNPMTVCTNRSINVTSSCTSWPVIRGGSGNTTNVTVALDNGNTYDLYIPVPGGSDQSTFMTNSQFDCGTGCSIVSVFEASATSPWYYSCNVSVHEVANATLPQHYVGTNLTELATAAIALQGYAASSLANDTNFQYQTYPAESIFGTPMNGTNQVMQMILNRFTIGVVAIAALNNPSLTLEGTMPMKGTKLNVSHWNMIHMILLLTAVLQLALGLAAALVANRVVVPDGGAVEMAQVMRSMAIQDRRANEEALEKGLTTEGAKGSKWIYRDTLVSKDAGIYDLHMEEQTFHARNEAGMIEMNAQYTSRGSTPVK